MSTKTKVKNDNFFDLLNESVKEGVQHAQGKITLKMEKLILPSRPPEFSKKRIRKIRDDLGVSQPIFGMLLGCTASAVKAWEQGDNHPNGSARRLLQLIEKDPQFFKENFSLNQGIKETKRF